MDVYVFFECGVWCGLWFCGWKGVRMVNTYCVRYCGVHCSLCHWFLGKCVLWKCISTGMIFHFLVYVVLFSVTCFGV